MGARARLPLAPPCHLRRLPRGRGRGLAACGGSSSPAASTAGPGGAGAQTGPAGGRGLTANPKVAACLKKQGVTLPGGRRGPGRRGQRAQPPGGTQTAPGGTRTAPGGGRFVPGGRFGGAGAARFEKLRAALKKCGVTLPRRGRGRPGARRPGRGRRRSRTSPT